MTTIPDHDTPTPLDLRARQLHADALAAVPPHTLARLRQARRNATAPARPALAPWFAGGALAASVALAVVMLPGRAPAPDPASPVAPAVVALPATDTTADPVGPLQEDPGFYLWLDSADATALAMESP